MLLSVIIPTYNGENLVKNNLPRVLEILNLYKGDVELIISDDCSTDNSIVTLEDLKTKLEKLHPKIKIKIFKNDKNLGFSSNINKAAKNADGEFLYLLNSDVRPENGFLEPLLRHFENEKVFAVGSMDKSIEGDKTILRGRGIGKWKRGFFVHSRGEVSKTNTLWVNGGSGVFRKSTWEKLGGFCELYNPFYWEDIDLSYRAQKSGYNVLFEPKSTVIHEHEKGAIKGTFSGSRIKTVAYRNQFIFVWKNISDLKMKIEHILWLPYHLLSAVLRGDTSFLKAFLNAFLLLPEIIKYKNREEKLFELRDKEVLAPFISEK